MSPGPSANKPKVRTKLRRPSRARTTGMGINPRRRLKSRRQPLSIYLIWLNGLAKTATLKEIIILCLKLCLIVSSLYGMALLNQLKELDALPPMILQIFDAVLSLRVYPTLQMSWPD